jgi:hypothetical protein
MIIGIAILLDYFHSLTHFLFNNIWKANNPMPIAINNKYIIMSDNISVSDVCFVPNKLIVIPMILIINNRYPLILNCAELLKLK